MNKEHSIIIDFIKDYLENNPDQRFGQAIFNLGINQFVNNLDSDQSSNILRDIYNDSDLKIIDRIKNQLEWFDLQKKVNDGVSKVDGIQGMTVNERLFVTGLIDVFDEYKEKNKKFAEYILLALKVDRESISKILG